MKRRERKNGMGLVGALGAGAALMYFLDPARGTRRRHLLRDQLVHARKVAGESVGTTSRDLRNRARGIAAEARSRVSRRDVTDEVLVERVRSMLGRVVSHPGAITVAAEGGQVTLGGQVMSDEVSRLLAGVKRVRGVRSVENRLQVHESAEGVSALQGGSRRDGRRSELAQENWTPAVRLLGGAVGGVLALYGASRGDRMGSALGLAGMGLAARGVTNLSARRLTGIGAGRRSVNVRKTITINAPVERVFEYFAEWERWPEWMSHVREVQRTGTVGGNERTHWVVDGPAGVPLRWNAMTTRFVHNEAIGWKSLEGERIRHSGLIRFRPTDDGATVVDVQMSYNPPAGAFGHAVAGALRRDPRQQMHDDLARLKTTIEQGRAPHDAARREAGDSKTRAELKAGEGSGGSAEPQAAS